MLGTFVTLYPTLSGNFLNYKVHSEGEDMERKLVTIRQIAAIEPIPDADAIEVLTVDGWKVVAKKGVHRVGEHVLYFEIDSFLPIREEFEFLRASSYKKLVDGTEGFRLKTVRLRGQISQGLVVPISGAVFSTLLQICGPGTKWDDLMDRDLTELYGVTKWEPAIPACLSGLAKGNFPSHTVKSDQERIQNLKKYFDLYEDEEFEMSLKLDGSSSTMYLHDDEFGVCSRNLDLKPDDTNSFWIQARKYNVENRLRALGKNISIQSELIGEGIQDNHEKIKGQDIYLFNIWDQDLNRFLTPSERQEMLKQINALEGPEIKHVPVLGFKKIFKDCRTVEDLLEFVKNQKAMNEGVILEGVVFKSVNLINGEVVSFKIINNEYLLPKKSKKNKSTESSE